VVGAGDGENVTGCCILTASSGALVSSVTNVFTYYHTAGLLIVFLPTLANLVRMLKLKAQEC
jgi:hypothetical protein